MPWSRIVRRLGGVLILASITLTLVAAPVHASGTTRWVDDDGKAGSSDCGGSKSAKKHIQDAVDASGPNDTVIVCPGTYTEYVTIKGSRDGLTLRSFTTGTAIIKAKAEATFVTTVLVTVKNIDDVTVKGFSIRPLRDDTSSYCDWSTGISATGATSISISHNEIKPSGQGPFCGVSDGIAVANSTTGMIKDNTVKDYREQGIHLMGDGTDVTVQDNSVTFAHVGLSPAGGAAIRVDTGARGDISGNTINGPAAGPGNPPQPAAGVDLDYPAADNTIADNTIARMAADIRVYHVTGGSISGNVMTGGQVGLDLLDGDDIAIHDNMSSDATVHGLAVGAGSHGDNVHDNDFRTNKNGNLLKDCEGETGTGVNNTWVNNLGSSHPAVLCNGRPGTVPG